jgi:hypothetical protein
MMARNHRFSGGLSIMAVVSAVTMSGCSKRSTGTVNAEFNGMGNTVTRVGGVPSSGELTLSGSTGTKRALAAWPETRERAGGSGGVARTA